MLFRGEEEGVDAEPSRVLSRARIDQNRAVSLKRDLESVRESNGRAQVDLDFGGRHLQYERFYMGPAFVVRSHNSRECDWQEIDKYVDALLASYGPGPILNSGIAAPSEATAPPESAAECTDAPPQVPAK